MFVFSSLKHHGWCNKQ